ncbi:unnamed protein product [Adineta steineri]|uniref:Methyltransferase type 11 domain-containing protein n=1 Tax=Adineta steineri TaxID=433720 RepID=A0A814W4H7_9BILA|nr:unnamed protein product [Adineta steineri]
MIRTKPLLTLLLCLFFFIIILKYRTLKNTILPSRIHILPSSPSTCLESYDSHKLHKSIFYMSMVHFRIPVKLSQFVENKTGFEIGAPSVTTWGNLGVYAAARVVDTTNFASQTFWESGLKDGGSFIWKNQTKGKQYIRDAVDLQGIPNEYYDSVCATDVLEHIANPFKALLEWLRIMKSGGLLLIIVPFKNVTFDRKRDVVRLEHLINDYHNKTSEADLSHLNEILLLHDVKRDLGIEKFEDFKTRSENNYKNRGLHQHVYDQELLYYIYLCLNLNIKIQYTWDYHNLIIGQKQ